ncbi:hypothetical protein E2320_000550 [Naja naja]|nr:hypothetical protein E2320_000550 [Naja naja]
MKSIAMNIFLCLLIGFPVLKANDPKDKDNPFDYGSWNSSAQGKAVLTPLSSCEVGSIEMSKTGFAANLKQVSMHADQWGTETTPCRSQRVLNGAPSHDAISPDCSG